MSVLNSASEDDDVFVRPKGIAEKRGDNLNRFLGTVTGIGPAVGFADTVVTSGLNLLGAVANVPTDIDSVVPDIFEPYHRDREFFQGVGDIVGAVGVGLGAPKLFVSGGRVAKLAENAGFTTKQVNRFAINTARADRWERALRIRDGRDAAKAATYGITRTGTETATARQAIVKGLQRSKVTNAAKESLIAETAIIATTNSSELLFGEDGVQLDEVLIGTAFGALPVGAAYLQSGRMARISALRAQRDAVTGEDQAARSGFRRGYDQWTDLHDQAISAQAVEDAGAATEAIQEGQSSAATVTASQDLATEVANLRGEVINRMKQNVTELGKGQPFSSRTESLTTRPTRISEQVDADQARLASDYFVENSDEAVAVSAIRPVKALQKTLDEQTRFMDEAAEAGDQAKFDRIAGHQIYVIERDGTSQNGVFRQKDYRDEGSLETKAQDGGMVLRDGSGFVLKDKTLLKAGGEVPGPRFGTSYKTSKNAANAKLGNAFFKPNEPAADKYFTSDALEQAAAEAAGNSRSAIVYLNPQEFLNMARPIPPNSGKGEGLKDIEKFHDVPFLNFRVEGNKAFVTGHEGRHRMLALAARGVSSVPVRFKSENAIRWSAPVGSSDFPELPTALVSENGERTQPFPVHEAKATTTASPPAQAVLDMTEAYATYEAALVRQNVRDLKGAGPGTTYAHLDAQHEAMDKGLLKSTDVGKTRPELLLDIIDAKVVTLRKMIQSGMTDVDVTSPTDVSKILGWRLHDSTGEYTEQARTIMDYARGTVGKPSAQGSINVIADNAVTATGYSLTPALQAQARDDVIGLLLDAPYDFNTRTRTSRLEASDNARNGAPVLYVQRPDVKIMDLDFQKAKEVARQEAVAFRKESLTNAGGLIADVVQLVRSNTISNKAAQNVHEIHVGSFRNASNKLFTRENLVGDNPTLSAALRIQTDASRLSDRRIGIRMAKIEEMANTFGRNGNEAVMVAEDQYAKAFYSGQMMKADFVQVGRQELDLDDAPTRRLIEELFPGKPQLRQKAHMFDVARARSSKAATGTAVYAPLEFDEDAVALINEQVGLSYEILAQNNALRAISNSQGVNQRRGHIMPRNLVGKEVVFFRNGPGGISHYIVGKTRAEAEMLAARALDADKTLVRASDISIKQYKSYVDDAFSGRLIDFTDPLKQTGQTRGRSLDTAIDYSGEGLRDRMAAIREGYRNITRRALELEFEQALNFAERAHGQSGWDNRYNFDVNKGNTARYSPWDEYRRLLLGESDVAPDSIVGQADTIFETGLEMAFAFGAKQLGLTDASGVSKRDQAVAERLWNNGKGIDIGSSFEDVLARTQGRPVSVDVQRSLQRLSKAVATATLRFLGFGHALLNVTSLATTMPAITQRLVRGGDETVEQWQDRIGPIADYLDGDIATINASKLFAEGITAAYNPSDEMRRSYLAAHKRGFFEASVLEALQQTIYTKPSNFKDALDPLIGVKSKRNPRGGFFTNISDKSEVMSRRISWGMGYALSKRIGREMSEDDRYAFAHWFANQTIANYDPRIRPDSFRGTMGIPTGLFQTFVVNYMQRLTEMVASGDRKALRVQMLAQGLTFGANSLPGYEVFSENFGNTSPLEENVTDRLYKAFGKDTADFLFAGTFANLPKLFPNNDEGLGIYTRGTITPQVPTVLDLASLPAVSIIKSGYEGISTFVKEVKATGQVSPQRIAELVAATSPVRATKSLAELFIGESYNRNGDLLSNDTRTPISVLARTLGTRTMTENKTMAHLYENGQFNRAKRDRIRSIGNVYTARVRENGGVSTPELREEFYNKFVQLTSERGASASIKNRDEKAAVLRVLRDIEKLDTQRDDGSFVNDLALTRLLGVAPAPGAHD